MERTCCACGCNTDKTGYTRITSRLIGGLKYIFEATGRKGGENLEVGRLLCKKERRVKKMGRPSAGAAPPPVMQPCCSAVDLEFARKIMLGAIVAKAFPLSDEADANYEVGTGPFLRGVVTKVVGTQHADRRAELCIGGDLTYEVEFAASHWAHNKGGRKGVDRNRSKARQGNTAEARRGG